MKPDSRQYTPAMLATSTPPNSPPSSGQKPSRCCNNHPASWVYPPSSGPYPTSPTGSTPTSRSPMPPRPPTPPGRVVVPQTRGRRPTPSPRGRDHSPHEPDPSRTRHLLERPERDDHGHRRGSDRTRSDPAQGLAPHRRHHETTGQPDQAGTVPSSGSSTNTTTPPT